MANTLPISLDDALESMFARIGPPLTMHRVKPLDGLGRTLAEDMPASIDSPSVDASLRDGYAVISKDVKDASVDRPVALKLAGHVTAGKPTDICVKPGNTVRVMTGAKIPLGADAVVPEECTLKKKRVVFFQKEAASGDHILRRGSDIAKGRLAAKKGSVVTPGLAGVLAAAGHSRIPVVRYPNVALIATGDEVVAPGQPLSAGKLYASNIVTLGAWCRRYGFQTDLTVVPDDADEMVKALSRGAHDADAVITGGGTWSGDKDLVLEALDRLAWRRVFHGIRMIPGKATGFGMLDAKPVFILSGTPPANLNGFLQIALPGLLKLAGYRRAGLPSLKVRTASKLVNQSIDATRFVYGTIDKTGDVPEFHPLLKKSRLRSIAEAQAVVRIPEGRRNLPAGAVLSAQMLEL